VSTKLPLNSNGSDDYQTPPEAFDVLHRYLPPASKIWECAAGSGNLVKRMKELRHFPIATDLSDGSNFLEATGKEFKWDYIITNPPYSWKNEFLGHCYKLCAGSQRGFALLLPLTALGSQDRQDLFRHYGISVLLLGQRINFEVPVPTTAHGSFFDVAWFCYQIRGITGLIFDQIIKK
jgi:hypothetical protein